MIIELMGDFPLMWLRRFLFILKEYTQLLFRNLNSLKNSRCLLLLDFGNKY